MLNHVLTFGVQALFSVPDSNNTGPLIPLLNLSLTPPFVFMIRSDLLLVAGVMLLEKLDIFLMHLIGPAVDIGAIVELL
jgi:hypothetical protein